jgi:hypothetical protein
LSEINITFPTINAPNEAVAKPEKLIPCCFNINAFVIAMTLKATKKRLLVAAPLETHVSLFSISSLLGKILYSLVGVTNLRLAVGHLLLLPHFGKRNVSCIRAPHSSAPLFVESAQYRTPPPTWMI